MKKKIRGFKALMFALFLAIFITLYSVSNKLLIEIGINDQSSMFKIQIKNENDAKLVTEALSTGRNVRSKVKIFF